MEPQGDQNLPKEEVISVANIYNQNNPSKCSYCGGSNSFGWRFKTHSMKVETYDKLDDRGWVRSSMLFFKPYLQKSCCFELTHRLDATAFRIRSSQRKTIRAMKNKMAHESASSGAQKNIAIEKVGKNLSKSQMSQENQQTKKVKIPEELLIKMKQAVEKVHKAIAVNFESFSAILHPHLAYQELNAGELGHILGSVKYFMNVSHSKKQEYYCNYVMVVYGAFKKKVKKQYKFSNFAKDFHQWSMHIPQLLNISVNKSGYLSFNFDDKPKQVNVQKMPMHEVAVKTEKRKRRQNNQIVQEQKIEKERFFSINENEIKFGKLTIEIKPAEFTEEKWQMYQIYRIKIHNRQSYGVDSFRRFLTNCVLIPEEKVSDLTEKRTYAPSWDPEAKAEAQVVIQGPVRKRMGLFHMDYYFEGVLIAVNAVHILPTCLESVYFFHLPEVREWRLGVFSALMDIEYVRWMNKSFPEFKYYKLCHYIQNCQKMSYKAEYEPAEVLCPETGRYVALTPEVKQRIWKIINKEVESIRLSDDEIIEDLQFPEQMQFYLVEKARIKMAMSESEMTPEKEYRLNQILGNMARKMGKELFEHFTWLIELL